MYIYVYLCHMMASKSSKSWWTTGQLNQYTKLYPYTLIIPHMFRPIWSISGDVHCIGGESHHYPNWDGMFCILAWRRDVRKCLTSDQLLNTVKHRFWKNRDQLGSQNLCTWAPFSQLLADICPWAMLVVSCRSEILQRKVSAVKPPQLSPMRILEAS